MGSFLTIAIKPFAILAGRRMLTMGLCLFQGQPALDDTAGPVKVWSVEANDVVCHGINKRSTEA